jgi:hypothetical protein
MGRRGGGAVIVPPVVPGDTLVHGASVQITALNGVPLSGLGTKVWSQPAWESIEDGTTGQRFNGDGRLYPGWRSFGATNARYTYPDCYLSSPSPPIYHPLVDNEHTRGGDHCTRAVKQHFYSELVDGGTAVNCQGSNYISCGDYPPTVEVYCSFWRYCVVPPGKQAFTPTPERDEASRNWKHCNSGNSDDWGGTGYPQQRYDVYPAVGNGHHFLNFAGASGGSGGEIAQNWGSGTSMLDVLTDQGVWQRFDVYTRHGTVADKDWRLGHWKDGVLTSWLDSTTNPAQADQPIYDEPSGRYFRGTSVNFYCTPSSAKVLRSDQGYPEYYILPNFGVDFWIDDLYLDCSPARIELGNASTWAACTHREIQPWTTWAPNAVTITVNHGVLAHGTQYLYAIKPDGTPFNANGHPVVLG